MTPPLPRDPPLDRAVARAALVTVIARASSCHTRFNEFVCPQAPFGYGRPFRALCRSPLLLCPSKARTIRPGRLHLPQAGTDSWAAVGDWVALRLTHGPTIFEALQQVVTQGGWHSYTAAVGGAVVIAQASEDESLIM